MCYRLLWRLSTKCDTPRSPLPGRLGLRASARRPRRYPTGIILPVSSPSLSLSVVRPFSSSLSLSLSRARSRFWFWFASLCRGCLLADLGGCLFCWNFYRQVFFLSSFPPFSLQKNAHPNGLLGSERKLCALWLSCSSSSSPSSSSSSSSSCVLY